MTRTAGVRQRGGTKEGERLGDAIRAQKTLHCAGTEIRFSQFSVSRAFVRRNTVVPRRQQHPLALSFVELLGPDQCLIPRTEESIALGRVFRFMHGFGRDH